MIEARSAAGLEGAIHTRRERVLLWTGVASLVALLLATAVMDRYATVSLVAVTAGLLLVVGPSWLLAWPTQLGVIIAVILFIPIKRYTMGGGLGFQVEPYRVIVALVLALWWAALLVDPQTRARRVGVEGAAWCFGVAVLISLLLNVREINAAGLWGPIVKAMLFFASFFVVMYLAAGAVQTRRQLDRILMLLVAGGAIVGLTAIWESRTGFNPFDQLDRVIPGIQLDPAGIPTTPGRDGRPRSYASAQHAIALGAALVMLIPMGIYLYRRAKTRGGNGRLWLAAIAILGTGALATQSRTGVIMLLAELIAYLFMRRAETVRLLPALLPILVVVQIVLPGTLGTIKRSFFPTEGSLVASEQAEAGSDGSGRLADVGPSLDEWSQEPFFGQGFGTRLPSFRDGENRNDAKILDDQWLTSLLEVGAAGVLALLWLFLRMSRRLAKRARGDPTDRGWLLSGLAAAIIAFVVGMFTYDAFAFIQVTFLAFITLGLSAALLAIEHPEEEVSRAGAGGKLGTAIRAARHAAAQRGAAAARAGAR